MTPFTMLIRRSGLALAAVLLLQALAPDARGSVVLQETLPDGQEIVVTLPFGDQMVPADGLLPVRVQLTNPRSTARQWNLSIDLAISEWSSRGNRRMNGGSETALTAAAGRVTTHELLVPMPGLLSDAGSCQISINASSGGNQTRGFRSPRLASHLGASLVGMDVARMNFGEFEMAASRVDPNWIFGTQIDPMDLPRDWRALMGWTGMVLSEAEWDGLRPDQRRAVLQWMRFGGRLLVFSESDRLEQVRQRIDGRSERAGAGAGYSFGGVEVRAWDGESIDGETVVQKFRGAPPENLAQVSLTGDVARSGVVPPLASGTLIFGVLLVVYCLLVGPLNLYVLAPAGRRHRLFFTTPVIAVGATGLMFALGMMRDGIGLEGARAVFVDLRPGESSAYLSQSQLYRSGMIGGTSFEEAMPLTIRLLDREDSPIEQQLSYDGERWGGSLFGSRRRDGHRLNAVRSTRERLEWTGADASEGGRQVASTLGWPLDELVVVDEQGKWWAASERLAPGGRVTLEPESEADAKAAVDRMLAESPVAAARLGEIMGARGRFFARTTEGGDAAAVETLESAKWTLTTVVATGPIGTSGSEGETSSEEDPS